MSAAVINHLRACAASMGADALTCGALTSFHHRVPTDSLVAIVAGAAVLAYTFASAMGSRS